MSADEVKEWVSVRTNTKGDTTISVSAQQGNCSAKWEAKSFGTSLKNDLKRVRTQARLNLTSLRTALAELEEE